jgi:hypothetical protein
MHAEVDSCMGGHRGISLLVRTVCRHRLLLTVEDTYQVDLQGRKPGRNRLAVYHGQGSSTDAKGTFGDPGVWDLGMFETVC